MIAKPSSTAAAQKITSVKKEFLIFISIPASIILLVILILVVPSLLAHPGYDFLYSNCSTYECSKSFLVGSDGRIKAIDASSSSYDNQARPDIYYHDTQKNSSRRIEFTEANSYK